MTIDQLVICNRAHLCEYEGCLIHSRPHTRLSECSSELCAALLALKGIKGSQRRCECVPITEEEEHETNVG